VSMWASVLSGMSSSLSVEWMGFKALAPDMTEERRPLRFAYVFSKICYKFGL
jgi:hypothetical protein